MESRLEVVTAFQSSNLPSWDALTKDWESWAQDKSTTLPKWPFSVRRSFVDGGVRILGSDVFLAMEASAVVALEEV
jgi:hypothetical protein